jgi:hypothetical protein
MTTPNDLSDKALAVFAFALYHQLSTGDAITAVVAEDGAGHKADPQAISELEERGLARHEGKMITFTDAGVVMLSQFADRVRGHW